MLRNWPRRFKNFLDQNVGSQISVINTDDINEGLLDLMIGAYIAGADVIRLESKKEIQGKRE